MQEQNRLNLAQRELEEALATMAPMGAYVDPIAAAFDAGRKSGRRQVRFWRATAAAMLLVGAGIWLVPVGHEATGPADQSPDTRFVLQSGGTAAEPLPEQSLLMLQKAVREKGLDGLPAAYVWPAQAMSGSETL